MISSRPFYITCLGVLGGFLFLSSTAAQEGISSGAGKKRDPFVALVNSDGKIKTEQELFQSSEKKSLAINIALKAIIWDEKRPLALINDKVYSEGTKVTGDVIIEKINPNSIVVNDSGNLITIQLRKTEKKQ